MGLSSIQLEAFVLVAREKHFSKAAKALGITQSALSLRIQNLEKEMETTLFIRSRAGVQLTHTAQELVRYCRVKDTLEEELLDSLLSSREGQLGGAIRIGGFSSVMRSVILPALAPLIRENRRLKLQMITRELEDLPPMLQRGEVDYLILDRRLDEDYLEALPLGEEEYVLVGPRKIEVPKNIFLDHDELDKTTLRFFQLQSDKNGSSIQRLFLDDIYGILDGVRLGLGRAVLPRHLIPVDSSFRIEKGYRSLKVPVVLHYFRQSHYSAIHQRVIDSLQKELL